MFGATRLRPALGAIVALTGLAFSLDLATDPRVLVGVTYVGIVWLAYWSRRRSLVRWSAAVCCALIVVAHAIEPETTASWSYRIDVALMCGIVIGTAVACDRLLGQRVRFLYGALLDAEPVALVMIDRTGAIAFINAEAERLFGYTRAELRGRPIEELMPEGVRGEHRELRNLYLERPVARQMGVSRDLHARRKDGSEFPVEIGLKPIWLETGLHVMSAIVDLTHRKEMELSLRRSNENLERINAELEQFAYVASHDLKQPLRGIDNLASWIVEDCADLLPDESRRHLGMLQGRIQRLDRLLHDLLSYSRIGRQEDRLEEVDTDEVVHGIAEMISPPPSFSIEVPKRLPKLRAHRAPLAQVFHNLIGNAYKHRASDAGSVRIEAALRDGFVEFSVSDDGPGIPPEFHDRIFGMFTTLRPRDEVEGSGMGLAIVKKVVESRGGTLTLESHPGAGATFRFTWPQGNPVEQDRERREVEYA